MKNPLRDFLARIIWDEKFRKREFKIMFVSRGAPNNIETISTNQLVSVGKNGFEYNTENGERKYIPFHRVREIIDTKTGRRIFSKEKSIYDFKV
ncbi:MAG: hypothetical protein DRJ35_04190 [Thermoprotei archaeon]|nr:MAG: hypothetical protein DRJ35_04190 [Thermoprotei archaeon]